MPPLLKRNWTTPCSPQEREQDAAAHASCSHSSGVGNTSAGHGGRGEKHEDCVCCGDSGTRAHPTDDTVQDLEAESPPKRSRHWPISFAEGASHPSMPVDTLAALLEYGLPRSLKDWAVQQDRYFGGRPVLPPGWIRVWSESRKVEYYCRLEDGQTTFDWSEMSTAQAVPS